jgi:methionyl-tRNA formyltransferase
MNKIKLGYFADGPWAQKAFDKIAPDMAVSFQFICARHNKPDPVLKSRADEYGIDFISHPNINSEEFFAKVVDYDCDLFVSLSFDQIFQKRILQYPRLKAINCHASKLPFYRGRNCLNWVLINDENEFGITVHYMDEGIDTGDILEQRIYPIKDLDNYATLLEKAYEGCSDVLFNVIKNLADGRKVEGRPQVDIHPLGFYCVGREVGDERLCWDQPSRDIFNFIRAICRPGPEASTYYEGVEIKINRVDMIPGAPIYKGIPGAILGKNSDSYLVKTADSFVKLVDWSGKNRFSIGKRFK